MSTYTPEGLRGTSSSGGSRRPTPPAKGLGLRGWLRWSWRQLTSMRVALLLLLLLTVVAMPGAFFPQRRVNPNLVTQFYADNPTLAPWLDRAYMFDVRSEERRVGKAWRYRRWAYHVRYNSKRGTDTRRR